jgi:ribosomal protein S17
MSYIYRHEKDLLKKMRSLNSKGAKEIFGQVIKTGYNKKTSTAQVFFWTYRRRDHYWLKRSSYIHFHDPYEICRLGDRVSVKACTSVSKIKSHYLSNFFQMAPRLTLAIKDMMPHEKQAIVENQELRKKSVLGLSSFFEDEYEIDDGIIPELKEFKSKNEYFRKSLNKKSNNSFHTIENESNKL